MFPLKNYIKTASTKMPTHTTCRFVRTRHVRMKVLYYRFIYYVAPIIHYSQKTYSKKLFFNAHIFYTNKNKYCYRNNFIFKCCSHLLVTCLPISFCRFPYRHNTHTLVQWLNSVLNMTEYTAHHQ
jgi:hypothetical protein